MSTERKVKIRVYRHTAPKKSRSSSIVNFDIMANHLHIVVRGCAGPLGYIQDFGGYSEIQGLVLSGSGCGTKAWVRERS
jgi:hypothetical protein